MEALAATGELNFHLPAVALGSAQLHDSHVLGLVRPGDYFLFDSSRNLKHVKNKYIYIYI